jgi:hypothetical protein
MKIRVKLLLHKSENEKYNLFCQDHFFAFKTNKASFGYEKNNAKKKDRVSVLDFQV